MTICIEIDNCCDCPYSHTERILTPDSWEHEEGIFCSKMKADRKYNGVNTDDRLIVSDGWNLRKWASIPDWCPMAKNKEEEK